MSHVAEDGELNDSHERYEHKKQIRRTVTRKEKKHMTPHIHDVQISHAHVSMNSGEVYKAQHAHTRTPPAASLPGHG